MAVWGPYLFKGGSCAGRRYVTITEPGKKKRNVLYSRYLMEQHLGRRLSPEEHVDHIDEDKTNDELGNLQILSRQANARKTAILQFHVTWHEFTCVCGKRARKNARQVRANHKKGKKGPFCSRQCAGRATREKQIANGQVNLRSPLGQ